MKGFTMSLVPSFRDMATQVSAAALATALLFSPVEDAQAQRNIASAATNQHAKPASAQDECPVQECPYTAALNFSKNGGFAIVIHQHPNQKITPELKRSLAVLMLDAGSQGKRVNAFIVHREPGSQLPSSIYFYHDGMKFGKPSKSGEPSNVHQDFSFSEIGLLAGSIGAMNGNKDAATASLMPN